MPRRSERSPSNMIADRKESDAEIQRVVRFIVDSGQEADLIKMTPTWSAADFLYAIERLEVDRPSSGRDKLRSLYRTLMTERESSVARATEEEVNGRRHIEMTQRLEELKKPHWTVLPNFWFTVVSAIAAVAAAVLTWIAKTK